MSMRRLPSSVVEAVDQSKILGIRAGVRSKHRFTGVWPVVRRAGAGAIVDVEAGWVVSRVALNSQ